MMPEPTSEPSYWGSRYREGTDRWDLGQPSPAFVALLNSTVAPRQGKIIVPGCGRGHDAMLFAHRGYSVLGFDFAPEAIAEATLIALRKNIQVTFVQQDLFALPLSYVESWDYVIEHTCFCAIDPARREEYVQIVHRLLKPGGELIAVFFAHPRSGGPPFRTDSEEIFRLFEPYFEIRQLAPIPISVKERKGEELFGRLIKREILAS